MSRFDSGPDRWASLEAQLTGRAAPGASHRFTSDANTAAPDLSAPPRDHPSAPRVPFGELHCHSNFSFLDGASDPGKLVETAKRLDLDVLALTDHDGLYGAVRFAQAARDAGVATAFGAELSLGLAGPQSGVADPEGTHLLVLARGASGYAKLSNAITTAHLADDAEKGRPVYDTEQLVDELRGHVLVLVGGCRKDAVRTALAIRSPADAMTELATLADRYGRDHVAVELVEHGLPDDSRRNDVLAAMAGNLGLPTIATNAVHYAEAVDGRLAAAMAAVRSRRSLDQMAGWLPPASAAFLRSGREMAHRFRRYPGAVARSAELGKECAFDLRLVAPRLPPFTVPDGHTEDSWLRHLTLAGARRRYGPPERHPRAYQQIEHELRIIAATGFAGYFLVVHDLVEFCHRNDILCQGRGSAANSAVCFALTISNVDAVKWKLLFERFLTVDRDGPPDIDLDIEAARREEVIQHVYRTHGRRNAAQVCNVITYRARSSIRDAALALGATPGQQVAWSKKIDAWSTLQDAGTAADEIPDHVLALAAQFEGAPRHLGIHSGGMVICDQPISNIVPVEKARKTGRTVLQWDKDDCADMGLVKFDLLGLGMLSAIRYALDLVREHHGVDLDPGKIDLDDPAVYAMLRKADTVGVFQVESRAQMSTLPRLKPHTFYDLVVEVALIRPGPIQGGSVHPYIRRRNGEKWQHLHPRLAPALDRTLGVPLFQEQVMQMAVSVADFTPAEADALRRAMGAKRSSTKMERLRARFYAGAARNGITGDLADRIFAQISAFSGYGFPESHSHSFAHIVILSAHLKLYYPAAFCAALLRAQPMGFYTPQSLVSDARNHGVVFRPADIAISLAHPTLEPDESSIGGHAVRLGLSAIRDLGDTAARRIADERTAHGPYVDMRDLARRVELSTPQMEALASAGALSSFAHRRREALWQAGAAARDRPNLLPGMTVTSPPPSLPEMTPWELIAASIRWTGVSPDSHPVALLRSYLDEQGVVPAARLHAIEPGTRVRLAGAVTHRQRPPTAGGVTFLSVEDETGLANIVVSQGLLSHYRAVVRTSPAVVVRGVVESNDGALNIIADQVSALDLRSACASSR